MENGTPVRQTAVLIAVSPSQELPELVEEHLDELAFLAETAGISTIRRYVQHLPNPDNRSFVGKGKLAEIKDFVTCMYIYTMFVNEMFELESCIFNRFHTFIQHIIMKMLT